MKMPPEEMQDALRAASAAGASGAPGGEPGGAARRASAAPLLAKILAAVASAPGEPDGARERRVRATHPAVARAIAPSRAARRLLAVCGWLGARGG